MADNLNTAVDNTTAQPLNTNTGVADVASTPTSTVDVGTAAWNTESNVVNGQVNTTYPNIASGIKSTQYNIDTSGMTQQGQAGVQYQQQMNEQLNNQTIQNYQNAFNQAYQTQQNANGKIDETYQQSAQNISNQYAIYRQNMGMNIANQGLNTGLGSQMQLSLYNSRNQSLAQNTVAHAQAVQAGEQALADLELKYRTAIAEAIGNNDLSLAQSLYEEIQNDENRKLIIAQTMAQYGDYSGYQDIYGSQTAKEMQDAYDKAKEESKSIQNAELLAEMGDFTLLADYYDWTDEQYANATSQWIYANPGYAYYTGKITAAQYYSITGQLPNSQTSNGGSGGGSGYGYGGGGYSGSGSGGSTTTNGEDETTKTTTADDGKTVKTANGERKVNGNIKEALIQQMKDGGISEEDIAKATGMSLKDVQTFMQKVTAPSTIAGTETGVGTEGPASGLNDYNYLGNGAITTADTEKAANEATVSGLWSNYVKDDGTISTGDPNIDAALENLRKAYETGSLNENATTLQELATINPNDNEYIKAAQESFLQLIQSTEAYKAENQQTADAETQQTADEGTSGLNKLIAKGNEISIKTLIDGIYDRLNETTSGATINDVKKQIGLETKDQKGASSVDAHTTALTQGFNNKDSLGNQGQVDINGDHNPTTLHVRVLGLDDTVDVDYGSKGIATNDLGEERDQDTQILAATLAAYYNTNNITDDMIAYALTQYAANPASSGMDLVNSMWINRSAEEKRAMMQADVESKDTGLIDWYEKFAGTDLNNPTVADVRKAMEVQQAYETGNVEVAAAKAAQVMDGAAISAALLNAVGGMHKLGYVNLESVEATMAGGMGFDESSLDLTRIMEQYNSMQEEIFGDASNPLNSWSYVTAMELEWVIGGSPSENAVLAFTKEYNTLLAEYGDNPTAEQCKYAKDHALLTIGAAFNPYFYTQTWDSLYEWAIDYETPYTIDKGDINYLGYLTAGHGNVSSRDITGLDDKAWTALGQALGYSTEDGSLTVKGMQAINKGSNVGTPIKGTVSGKVDSSGGLSTGTGGTYTADKSKARQRALERETGVSDATKAKFIEAAGTAGWDYQNVADALNGRSSEASLNDVQQIAKERMIESKKPYWDEVMARDNAAKNGYNGTPYGSYNPTDVSKSAENSAEYNAKQRDEYLSNKYGSYDYAYDKTVGDGSAYLDRQNSINGWNDYMANNPASGLPAEEKTTWTNPNKIGTEEYSVLQYLQDKARENPNAVSSNTNDLWNGWGSYDDYKKTASSYNKTASSPNFGSVKTYTDTSSKGTVGTEDYTVAEHLADGFNNLLLRAQNNAGYDDMWNSNIYTKNNISNNTSTNTTDKVTNWTNLLKQYGLSDATVSKVLTAQGLASSTSKTQKGVTGTYTGTTSKVNNYASSNKEKVSTGKLGSKTTSIKLPNK